MSSDRYPEAELNASEPPPLIHKEDVTWTLWWTAGSMIAAGVLTSGERLILAPVVGAVVFLLMMCLAIMSGLVARRRWRRRQTQSERTPSGDF